MSTGPIETDGPASRHNAAHYRLLINVVRFLLSQPPCAISGNRSGEIRVTRAGLEEDARDWFDLAVVVWFESRQQHSGQEGCICPECIERQHPILKRFQEEST